MNAQLEVGSVNLILSLELLNGFHWNLASDVCTKSGMVNLILASTSKM